ncbi:MAG: hypothetical protein SOH95_04730 [Bifidobacterium crudilactis]|jgi:hypothetical protein|nr:hypothetical protein [Bifidobacterium crudilactis]
MVKNPRAMDGNVKVGNEADGIVTGFSTQGSMSPARLELQTL